MMTTIRLIGAFFVAFCLASALPSEDVFAQDNRGSLKGKPPGTGGGNTCEPLDPSEVHLVTSFHDPILREENGRFGYALAASPGPLHDPYDPDDPVVDIVIAVAPRNNIANPTKPTFPN